MFSTEYILCDDNPLFTKLLAEKLLAIGAQEGWDVSVKIFHTPYALLRLMDPPKTNCKRFYFLDIEMPGVTGFELAKIMGQKENPAPIIFVSARNELVFQSLEYRPLHFLRKNYLEAELFPLLKRLHKEYGQTLHRVQLASGKQRLEVIPEKIAYAESGRNYVFLHTEKSKLPLRLRMQLEVLEQEFLPFGFIRVHKSYLVNRTFVQQLCRKQVLLTTGQVVDIGKKWEEHVRLTLCSPCKEW